MSLPCEDENMNQSEAEAKQLEQEAIALFNRSKGLNNEAIKKSTDAGVAYEKYGSTRDIKALEEGDNLQADAKLLRDEAKLLRIEGQRLLAESKKLNPLTEDSKPSANYVTCSCQHCGKGIEFNAAELAEENCVVPCPHCGLETKLFIPQQASPQKVEASIQNVTTGSQKTEAPIPSEKELNDLTEGLTADEIMQSLNIKDWAAKTDFLRSLQKSKANRMKIVSINNELELADDNVIIRRHGVAHAMAAGLTGERMIPISTLTAIQLKLGVWWSPGFILFSYAGSKPFMGGIIEATQDPDAFIFQKELNDEVSTFKAKVEKILRDSKQAASSNKISGTITDELRKLAEFKQQGILSQEEFDAAKKKLLT
jgi:Short C-terminal domain